MHVDDLQPKPFQLLGEIERLRMENACLEISLRDKFAMAALQGSIASGAAEVSTYESDATSAYKWADAMMKARKEAS